MDEWNFSPAIIAEAQEIGIGARVACHWSEAECQDQEGTVVGVEIHRRGKVEYTVHIDGDISPTDGFTHDIAGIEGGTIRLLSTSPALPAVDGGEMVEKLRMEAQGHAMEARAANATIHEIYQVISGATGEPGNWNGAEPVRQYVAAAEARVLSLEEEVKRLRRLGDTLSCITFNLAQPSSPLTNDQKAVMREAVTQWDTGRRSLSEGE